MRAMFGTPLTGNAAADARVLLRPCAPDGRTPRSTPWRLPRGSISRRARTVRWHEMGETLPGAGPARLTVAVDCRRSRHAAVLPERPRVAEGTSGEVTSTTCGPGGLPGRGQAGRPRLARSRGSSAIRSTSICLMPGPSAASAGPRRGRGSRARRWHLERDSSDDRSVGRRAAICRGWSSSLGPRSRQPVRCARRAAASGPCLRSTPLVADVVSAAPARVSVQLRSADGTARWWTVGLRGARARAAGRPLERSEFRSADRDGRRFDRAVRRLAAPGRRSRERLPDPRSRLRRFVSSVDLALARRIPAIETLVN